jgi:protein gp37
MSTINGKKYEKWIPFKPDNLTAPLNWRKLRHVEVTWDLFSGFVPYLEIDKVFAVMAVADQHTFRLSTKNPAQMMDYITGTRMLNVTGSLGPPEVLPNVWLGVKIRDQKTADERIPLLLRTPAALRFVSADPLLGPVNLTKYLDYCVHCDKHGIIRNGRNHARCDQHAGIDWVVIAGESGPNARPFDIQWARDVIGQCREAGVLCCVEQLGSVPAMNAMVWKDLVDCGGVVPLLNARNDSKCLSGQVPIKIVDRNGSDMAEWPKDLQVREYPAEVIQWPDTKPK